MKRKQPEPFMFKGDERAVLLLHGFTGHSADVRMLGRHLNSEGYTCYAPIYRGHGKSPEDLVNATAEQWWEDVKDAYQYLQTQGYQKIAVVGLSLGGVLGLRLACNNPVQGIVTMCSPMFFDNESQLTIGFRHFAKEFKQLEGKDELTIQQETEQLLDDSKDLFKEIEKSITRVKDNIDMLYTPTLVAQAKQDEMINPDSANYIYENVESNNKQIKWYENAGHAITFSKAKDQLHEDIAAFFASLDW
ncbi:alpha/beta fold hydrolase [Gracilibacillus caseinilyticus]|uniref:Alpha/beta fold hydrolase n=1 Tax=Gracilibacillus caseinilyticus TaxID=2932256 RepID=A0ABY4EVA9_9BACI|nr:alpha/beta fold hydrolase [Gracilibacillus caseinilyticus]UOQ48229.1 alpha/beta fold hydrolase [Gracilibacillus caseinilyticus]